MALFKSKEKTGIKCPACGSMKTTIARGTQALMAYPGFYSGISSAEDSKEQMWLCKDCKNVFRIE